MPFILDDGQIVEWRVYGGAFGQEVNNTLHFRVNSVTGTVTAQALLVQLAGEWSAEICDVLNASYATTKYELWLVNGVLVHETGPRLVYAANETLVQADAGQAAVDALPTYVSANCRKVTEGPLTVGYFPAAAVTPVGPEKFFKGRMALGPLSEQDTTSGDSNILEAASRTAILTRLDTITGFDYLPAGGEDVTLDWIIISLLKNEQVRLDANDDPVLAYQFFTQWDVPFEVGSQISRKQKATN